MEQFSMTIVVEKQKRLFQFTRIENTNGVKYFVVSSDSQQKPVAFSLRQNRYDEHWKLNPGSLRWLYSIEEKLSQAINERA